MVPLQVLHHLEPLLGSVGAVAAAERLLLCVGQVVMPEPRRPAEGFLTQPAGVGPSVVVLLLVGLQRETRFEGLAAFLADKRPRVAVLRVPVYAEGVGSVSAIFTLVTGVWFLP